MMFLCAALCAGQAARGNARVRYSWLENQTALPGYGLVAGWDLTGWPSGTQSVPNALPDGAALQNGSTSGSDANDVTWSTAGAVFNGSNSYMVCSGLSSSSWSSATVIAVVNPNTASGYRTIIAKRQSSAPYAPWELFKNTGDSKIGFWNGTNPPSTGSFVYSGGTWASVAVAAWASNLQFYANGVASGSSVTYGYGAENNAPVTVGNCGASCSEWWTGTISYILIYNRVLPASEILRMHRVLKRNLAVQGVALP
jgi:hypothetical protein